MKKAISERLTADQRSETDALAALPESPAGPTLAETIALPACAGFRGVQVVVATDRALVGSAPAGHDGRRWVLLGSAGLEGVGGDCPAPAVRPWLWIDTPDRVPQLLLAGWREAQHGS